MYSKHILTVQSLYITDFKCNLKAHGDVSCFCQDLSDFEWTFWTEWAKKSLLWTLIGHGLISRLTSIFYPKVQSSCYSTV